MSDFPYLARKIKGSRWEKKPYISVDDIRADSVTCLRSSSDKLSFWRCNNEKVDAGEALLAVAAQGNVIEKMEIILISEEDLNEVGCKLDPKEGNTPITDIKDRHVDLVELNQMNLVNLAKKLGSVDIWYKLTKCQ